MASVNELEELHTRIHNENEKFTYTVNGDRVSFSIDIALSKLICVFLADVDAAKAERSNAASLPSSSPEKIGDFVERFPRLRTQTTLVSPILLHLSLHFDRIVACTHRLTKSCRVHL